MLSLMLVAIRCPAFPCVGGGDVSWASRATWSIGCAHPAFTTRRPLRSRTFSLDSNSSPLIPNTTVTRRLLGPAGHLRPAGLRKAVIEAISWCCACGKWQRVGENGERGRRLSTDPHGSRATSVAQHVGGLVAYRRRLLHYGRGITVAPQFSEGPELSMRGQQPTSRKVETYQGETGVQSHGLLAST